MLAVLIFVLALFGWGYSQDTQVYIAGKFPEERIDSILKQLKSIKNRAERVSYISSLFLDLPYKRVKLDLGDGFMVVKLDGVDCMTFVEYVETLSISNDFFDFIKKLQRFRYYSGVISHRTRKHFFTDWIGSNGYRDVGKVVGGSKAVLVKKHLNYSEKKGIVIKDVPVKNRTFYYIPSNSFTPEIVNRLKTGDIVGAYSPKDWLDVSHIGYIIKKGGNVYFRNASSRKEYKKVVDIPLWDYLKRVEGLVILRKENAN
ncbi:MAG: DUF1460 domain-containing protein [Aquificae bacterium]|nr:DUF1460 domain-containing protein [Aquificota bacterium]